MPVSSIQELADPHSQNELSEPNIDSSAHVDKTLPANQTSKTISVRPGLFGSQIGRVKNTSLS